MTYSWWKWISPRMQSDTKHLPEEGSVHNSRMHGINGYFRVFFLQPSIQLSCKQDIGQLRLFIGPSRIIRLFRIQIFPIHNTTEMRHTRNINYPRRLVGLLQ